MFIVLQGQSSYIIKVTLAIILAINNIVNVYAKQSLTSQKDRYCVTEACIETANSLFKVRKICIIIDISNNQVTYLITLFHFFNFACLI